MHNVSEKYNQLKEILTQEDFRSILIYALSHHNLAKLVNKLGLNTRDIKTTKKPTQDLADLLASSAFSDLNVFQEVSKALDLYSGEAARAVQNNSVRNFQDSSINEKGHRGKTNMARLVWALLNENSSEKGLEGKRLLSEFSTSQYSSNIEEREDGEDTDSQQRIKRAKKRKHGNRPKRQPETEDTENRISELKKELEQLKEENTRLLNQAQTDSKDIGRIKELEKKLRLQEKTFKELKERVNKDYVPKEKFDAIKKETDRVHRLYKDSSRQRTSKDNQILPPPVDNGASLWEGLRKVIGRSIPFSPRRWCDKKGKNCRVGIFVDVQNMFYSAKNLHHGRLDFEKFLELALQGRKLVQATAYIVKTPEIDQSKFINLLKNNQYSVKTLDLKTGMNGYAKGNWDVGMVMDIFELADKMDVIALASGDGDFVPILKYLQKKGIRVEVYAFAYNTAIDLKECADKFIPLQENILIKDQRGVVKQHER